MTVIHFSAHYPVFSSILMAYSVAANTRLAGSAQGNFLDDLTNRMSLPASSSSRYYNAYPYSSGRRAVA